MNNGTKNEKIELEPNSKPYLFKRIISDGFDTVVIFLLFMVLSAALFISPLAKTYNDHYDRYMEIQNAAVEEFGDDAIAIRDSLNGNDEYRDERFAANLHGYLLKLLAGLLAEAPVLLIVPLVSKTRGTPGKLFTKIMPFCMKKSARASRLQVFGRFIFVFIIDSAGLYLLTGIYTFLLVPVLRLIVMLLNKKNRTILDFLSGITIIETLSYNGIDNI